MTKTLISELLKNSIVNTKELFEYNNWPIINLFYNNDPINNRYIIAFYGHTSLLDHILLYNLWRNVLDNGFHKTKEFIDKYGKEQCKNYTKSFKFLGKHKILMENFTPSFVLDNMIFKEDIKDLSQNEFPYNTFVCVEGTRGFKDYIHSGFLNIAKNNNMKIIFMIFNHKEKKIEVSKLCDPYENNILENLRILVKDKICAFYPENCSSIQFRGE